MRERGLATLAKQDTGNSSADGAADRHMGPTVLPVRGRRRPWLIALGVLFACVGALGVVWMVGAAGQRQEVLVVRHELAYGDEVTAADLGIARVSVDPGVKVIPAARRSEVIGLVADTRLAPGTLLTSDSLTSRGGPAAGQVLVPVALAADRMPAGGLQAGDRILAVTTRSEQGTSSTAPAVVVRVGPMDVNGVSVVDVTTSASYGPSLAVAAADGSVAIVVQPSEG